MSKQGISKLSERSKIVFQHIVDSYLTSGEPVGSKTLSRVMNPTLSAATIRGVMADLEEEAFYFLRIYRLVDCQQILGFEYSWMVFWSWEVT